MLALAFLLGPPAYADLIDDLAKPPEVIDVKLAPLGDFLAVLKEQDAQRVVAVFEFPAMKLVNLVDFPGRSEVANFWWVNERRLLFTVALDWGNRADDLGYGQLYAVDATGEQGKYLDVVRGASSAEALGSGAKSNTDYVSATLATENWDDREHVLINTREFSDGDRAPSAVAKLNVYSGVQTDVLPEPQPGAELLPQHPEQESAAAITGLEQLFSGAEPLMISASRDGSLAIVRVVKDTRTPEFYLFDRSSKQLRLLFDAMPWVDDGLLPAMQLVTIPARDGAALTGFLSFPVGVEGKSLPLVVIPHASEVRWGFGRANFVSAAGYATLQLNPRGGQHDLSDATRWAIEQGLADPQRICIFGWGAAGHGALMAAIGEPQLYQCAVAGAGVYGERQVFTAAGSALANADRIEVPLLLVHGDDDQLAPIEPVYALQQAINKADGPSAELLVLENAPHYPRREDDVGRWYRRAVGFFAQHIGPGMERKPTRRLLIAEPPIP